MERRVLVLVFLCVSFGCSFAFFKELGKLIPEKVGKILPDAINPLNLLHTNRCISDLGCFYTGPPFHDALLRPISLPPTYDVGTKFHLFTPEQRTDSYELSATEDSVYNSTFDPNRETKFLIHGFLSELDYEDIRFRMKDAILNYTDCNIIVVDWTANNGHPYSQAVSNARVTGANAAKLANFLIEKIGLSPSRIHIIGHSLGAHVAGYFGERVPNVRRITGLDPAGPWFNGMPPEVRLDETDALFVDVIHTDANKLRGLGYLEPIGHMDFYPNGGFHQVGCIMNPSDTPVIGTVLNFTTDMISSSCDHERANKYFLESIDNSECRFLAVLCESHEDYENGMCDARNSSVVVAEMGFHAERPRGLTVPAKFYLRTNESKPFCIDENSIFL